MYQAHKFPKQGSGLLVRSGARRPSRGNHLHKQSLCESKLFIFCVGECRIKQWWPRCYLRSRQRICLFELCLFLSRLMLERNYAVLDYLKNAGFEQSATMLATECKLTDSSSLQKSSGMLEKKWTSVIRLQKKVRTYLVCGKSYLRCAV